MLRAGQGHGGSGVGTYPSGGARLCPPAPALLPPCARREAQPRGCCVCTAGAHPASLTAGGLGVPAGQLPAAALPPALRVPCLSVRPSFVSSISSISSDAQDPLQHPQETCHSTYLHSNEFLRNPAEGPPHAHGGGGEVGGGRKREQEGRRPRGLGASGTQGPTGPPDRSGAGHLRTSPHPSLGEPVARLRRPAIHTEQI